MKNKPMDNNFLDKYGPQEKNRLSETITSTLLNAILTLKYGSVEVIVHDGKVVEIDRKERIRVDPTK